MFYLVPLTLNSTRIQPDLVRRVEGTREQAEDAARAYERELNNGVTWREAVSTLTPNLDAYFVTPETYQAVCCYQGFKDWKCNQETNA